MRILILGAGVMQMPALRIAKRWGWQVLCADGNPDAPGKHLADLFFPIDLKDRVKLEEEARSQKERDGLDGVFTAGTDFSSSVAWVAERLGLPGVPFQVAVNATDKVRMRECFKKHGVASPLFRSYEAGDDCETILQALPFPLVVKPVDNMGARGVVCVQSREVLIQALEEAVQYSRTSRAIVESYMEGREFSLDALIYRGEVILCGFADRKITFPPYFVEMGHQIPSLLSQREKEKIVALFQRGIEALGIDNGAAKGDLKLTKKGPMVGEIAARLSGGYMSGWTYPYSSGVSPLEGALRIAVGQAPGEMAPRYEKGVAEHAFISLPGRVRSLQGKKTAERRKGVVKIFCSVKKGERVRFPRNNVEKCGNVLVRAETVHEAAVLASAAACDLVVRLDPKEKETGDFLNDPLPYPGPAFLLKRHNNLRFLEEATMQWGVADFHKAPIIARPFPVQRLPEEREEIVKDWHGNTLAMVFQRLVTLGAFQEKDTSLVTEGEAWLWQALVRGSYQGVLWVLDRG